MSSSPVTPITAATTTNRKNNLEIAIWLLLCCTVIFAMITLGGVTRLTGSGLSMVEWAPIMGTIPPMNHAEWQEAFQLYQQYPEYKIKNFDMTLDGFQSIFWFEYSHRMLGRFIGIIFLLPFLYFLFRNKIEKTLMPKLITMFVLGGLQGLMGWYMVKSGLINDPHVSQYRLTAHLALAVIIYSYMMWVALGLIFPKSSSSAVTNEKKGGLKRLSVFTTIFIFIIILSGGFVAGTRAGFAFNTFPLMNGQLIPDGLFTLTPLWRNFFENIVAVQFNHRLLVTLLFINILIFWFKAGKAALQPLEKIGRHILLLALITQVTLGISTLLMVVPVSLAATHQAGAILLLTTAIFFMQQLHR